MTHEDIELGAVGSNVNADRAVAGGEQGPAQANERARATSPLAKVTYYTMACFLSIIILVLASLFVFSFYPTVTQFFNEVTFSMFGNTATKRILAHQPQTTVGNVMEFLTSKFARAVSNITIPANVGVSLAASSSTASSFICSTATKHIHSRQPQTTAGNVPEFLPSQFVRTVPNIVTTHNTPGCLTISSYIASSDTGFLLRTSPIAGSSVATWTSTASNISATHTSAIKGYRTHSEDGFQNAAHAIGQEALLDNIAYSHSDKSNTHYDAPMVEATGEPEPPFKPKWWSRGSCNPHDLCDWTNKTYFMDRCSYRDETQGEKVTWTNASDDDFRFNAPLECQLCLPHVTVSKIQRHCDNVARRESFVFFITLGFGLCIIALAGLLWFFRAFHRAWKRSGEQHAAGMRSGGGPRGRPPHGLGLDGAYDDADSPEEREPLIPKLPIMTHTKLAAGELFRRIIGQNKENVPPAPKEGFKSVPYDLAQPAEGQIHRGPASKAIGNERPGLPRVNRNAGQDTIEQVRGYNWEESERSLAKGPLEPNQGQTVLHQHTRGERKREGSWMKQQFGMGLLETASNDSWANRMVSCLRRVERKSGRIQVLSSQSMDDLMPDGTKKPK